MKRPKIPRCEKTVATFEMVVSYEELPSQSEIQELIEKAREYGGVDKATLTIHKRIVQEIV